MCVVAPPDRPKIYHITHVDNLPGIVAEDMLLSDRRIIERGGPKAAIGMSRIKQRRLNLQVPCHPSDRVGDYVPFYYCPRSIMLYVIYRANHPELTYRGGQGPIVHLQADAYRVIEWAEESDRRWAVSLQNAGADYAEFRCTPAGLAEIDWAAVRSRDFESAEVKEGKQAEFLLHHAFPWELVDRIGVHSGRIGRMVTEAIGGASYQPPVDSQPEWYY